MLCFCLCLRRCFDSPPIHPLNKSHRREKELLITELLNYSEWFLYKVAYKRTIEKVRKNRFNLCQSFSHKKSQAMEIRKY